MGIGVCIDSVSGLDALGLVMVNCLVFWTGVCPGFWAEVWPGAFGLISYPLATRKASI